MILNSRIEGTGSPMIILHGFLGMLDNWKTLATQFANDGFQVHSLDLRNHGKSFHSTTFNYEVMVEDVYNYIEAHQLKECILLGHSMGGKVAMLFATTYPNIVSKLIVADIGPKYYAPHHQTILEGLNAVNFELKPSRNDVEQILAHAITDKTYLMFEGGILKAGKPEELVEDEMVRRVYLGQNFELRKTKIDFNVPKADVEI